MKFSAKTAAASAALGLALAAMPVVHAQQVAACQRVEFSQGLLERFPTIRDSCLDVISRDGLEYAVIKGNLIRTQSDGVTMRFKRPDGTRSDSRFIKVKPDFRVLVDKKPTRVEDLAVGQELTAYVKVREPMIALEPAATTEPLDLTPIADAEPALAAANTASMPATASQIPAMGVIGIVLLLLGCVLGFMRSRLYPR